MNNFRTFCKKKYVINDDYVLLQANPREMMMSPAFCIDNFCGAANMVCIIDGDFF